MTDNTKKFHKGWWVDQVNAGIRFREKYAKENEWDVWRQMYRGEWDSDVLPLNLYFIMMRVLVPRVYFRNPSVSIQPGKPGMLNAVFAQILGRVDNKLFVSMKLKKHIKKMVQDAFLFGTGVGKLGFGAEFTPTPVDENTEAPISTKWGTVEYRSGIMPNMPWFSRVHPGNFIIPDMTEDIDDAMWCCHEIDRPLLDVKNDPRLKGTSDLKPTRMARVNKADSSYSVARPIEMIKLWEIRDKKYQRVIVMSPDHKKKMLEEIDYLQVHSHLPFFELIFNNDDEVFWGVPDAKIIEPQQLEINESRTMMMKHRRISIIKLLVEEGAMDVNEAEKMTNEEVLAMVKVKDINRVKTIQAGDIPSALHQMGELIHSDVRETLGFSRNQMGELVPKSGDTTATEASIVQQASEIRVDERRDMVADLIVNMTSSMHNIIFNAWGEEQVIDLVGPGGIKVWVEFSGEMLKGGAYEVLVDPDSAIPQTRQNRENKAVQAYQILKENPMIDPMMLTKYLLRELHGVQYDDMMRGLPGGAGVTQPMNVGQYGQMMQNGMNMGLPQLPPGGGGK